MRPFTQDPRFGCHGSPPRNPMANPWVEPKMGIEPMSCSLRVSCSANLSYFGKPRESYLPIHKRRGQFLDSASPTTHRRTAEVR